jgi:hypothetical protein
MINNAQNEVKKELKTLEMKAKAGWKMYFLMKEQIDFLSSYMESERIKHKKMIESIKNDEDIDITHLKNQFIELYEKVNDKLECPVCFEILTGDKIEVPNCGHLICKGCKETICKSSCKCPICKKKYFVKPS